MKTAKTVRCGREAASDPSVSQLLQIRDWLAARQSEMIATLKEFVENESPTQDKPGCDKLCAMLQERFRQIGGRVKLHKQRKAGDHLQADFAGARGRKPILLLGHYDTVYSLGTLATLPWRQSKELLYGPGVFDMKGGIVQMIFAIRALQYTLD